MAVNTTYEYQDPVTGNAIPLVTGSNTINIPDTATTINIRPNCGASCVGPWEAFTIQVPCESTSVLAMTNDVDPDTIRLSAQGSQTSGSNTGTDTTTTHHWTFTLLGGANTSVSITGAAGDPISAADLALLETVGLFPNTTSSTYDRLNSTDKNIDGDPALAFQIQVDHQYTGTTGCLSDNTSTVTIDTYETYSADNETNQLVSGGGGHVQATGPGTTTYLPTWGVGGVSQVTGDATRAAGDTVLDQMYAGTSLGNNYFLSAADHTFDASPEGNTYEIIEYQTPLDAAPVTGVNIPAFSAANPALHLREGFSVAWDSLVTANPRFELRFGNGSTRPVSGDNWFGDSETDRFVSIYYSDWIRTQDWVNTTSIYAIVAHVRNDGLIDTFRIDFVQDYGTTKR